MSEKQPKGVIEAIRKVSAALAEKGVAKARRNEQQRFMFRGIDDVYQALSPLLAEYGVVIVPRVAEREVIERKTAKGTTMFDVTLKVEYDIFGADGSSIEACIYGQAMDTGDKATNKAMSMAYKYLAFQLFCIPVEGEEDADATTPEETVTVRTALPKKPAQLTRKAPHYEDPSEAAASLKKAKTIEGLKQVWTRVIASGFLLEEMEQLTQTKDDCKALLEAADAQE